MSAGVEAGGAATVTLLAASALHLGFQLTVTAVVYPALAAAPEWAPAHRAHTRAITPVVVVVYGVLAVAVAWALVVAPREGWVLAAAAGAAVSAAVTAFVAGPAHGRLAHGRDEALLRRLLTADRVRTAGALTGTAAALVAVLR